MAHLQKQQSFPCGDSVQFLLLWRLPRWQLSLAQRTYKGSTWQNRLAHFNSDLIPSTKIFFLMEMLIADNVYGGEFLSKLDPKGTKWKRQDTC